MATIKSELTCQFTHLQVRGYCKIRAWGGAEGLILMTPFNISEKDVREKNMIDLVKAGVNDAGFGAQDILSFHAMIDACYEHGAREYMIDEIFYNLQKDQILSPKEQEEFDRFEMEAQFTFSQKEL